MSVRETWVFPSDGSPAYKRGEEPPRSVGRTYPAFIPDMPDFVSPVDGKRYSGRAGMREHNKRNNTVSNLDLKGLPVLKTHGEMRSQQEIKADKRSRVEQVARLVNQHYR